MAFIRAAAAFSLFLASPLIVHGFLLPAPSRATVTASTEPSRRGSYDSSQQYASSTRSETAACASAPPPEANRAKPRTGPAQMILDAALASPLWKYLLVPQARAKIVKTAEANGIQWNKSLKWIREQDGPWKDGGNDGGDGGSGSAYPSYYTKSFHAYDDGNLSWEAAFEQELAGRAVGARNFPAYGEAGEDAFRAAFDVALDSLGASVPDGGTVIDLGCGTGTSTRRLAGRFPDAGRIVGLDLSPYFIGVGRRLLDLAPRGAEEGGPWVTTVEPDDRIELQVGDATSTGLPNACADVVNVGLVIHELPTEVSMDICDEAWRLLKPGGQLWLYEMDFDSPAFASQRSNALLFSLIRSTEPYLDEYADGCAALRVHLAETFDDVRITAATGRHYALVATKREGGAILQRGSIDDWRFNADGTYAVKDTHLKTWESKKKE